LVIDRRWLREARKCVPFSAVTTFSASCLQRRRRFLRSRVAHALAFLLALAMIAGGAAAAASPVVTMVSDGNGNTAHAMAGEHCGHRAAAASHHDQAPRHGEGCPCCIGKLCACGPLVAASPMAATPLPSIVPRQSPPAASIATAYVTASLPMLRPPIG